LFNSVKKAVSPFGVDESFASAPFYEYKGPWVPMFSDTTVSCRRQKDSYYRALSNQKLD